jgi:hypothetical protein
LEVSDSGKGLSVDMRDQVFELHSEGSAHLHSKNRGLGLVVAKALIESHGGEISVHSKKNKGTMFRITLPTKSNPPAPAHLEKRRYRRINVHLPAEMQIESLGVVKGTLTVLSAHGCFFNSHQTVTLPKNAVVAMKIFYLENEVIEIEQARVASSLNTHHTSGYGFEFMEIGDKAGRILAALVKSHSSY